MNNFPFSLSELTSHFGAAIYPDSVTIQNDSALFLLQGADGRGLAIVALPDHEFFRQFLGRRQPFRDGYILGVYPLIPANARALRTALPGLQPRPLGLATSAGFGDRLGLATPGHVRALRQVLNSVDGKATLAPIFAQQSIREMTRAGRTPSQVLDEATWGPLKPVGLARWGPMRTI